MTRPDEVEMARIVVLQVDELVRGKQAIRGGSIQSGLGFCIETAKTGRTEVR